MSKTQNETTDLQTQIEKLNEELKTLKAQKKQLEAKPKKEKKGEPMMWTNKKGQQIKGMATLYYCITVNGVTHLKAVDSPEIVKLDSI